MTGLRMARLSVATGSGRWCLPLASNPNLTEPEPT